MLISEPIRVGEWLEFECEELRAGSHPHEVRIWLLAHSSFPAKWINRLFASGGIRWQDNRLQLRVFLTVPIRTDPLYSQVKSSISASSVSVLYEDMFCLVVHKPAGLPVHSSYKGQVGTLDQAVARHMLEQDDPLPVRHIHRLDDDTSGPVLYAKNDLAQLKLDEAMRNKTINRIYIAVIQGKLRTVFSVIRAPIGKDRHHKSRRRVSPTGDLAVTYYEQIATNSKVTIVRVQLETGRTHQIRVHMSHIGHPLLGDELYGGAMGMLNHQALHGESLLFPHPWTGEPVQVKAPWPDWLKLIHERL